MYSICFNDFWFYIAELFNDPLSVSLVVCLQHRTVVWIPSAYFCPELPWPRNTDLLKQQHWEIRLAVYPALSLFCVLNF